MIASQSIFWIKKQVYIINLSQFTEVKFSNDWILRNIYTQDSTIPTHIQNISGPLDF